MNLTPVLLQKNSPRRNIPVVSELVGGSTSDSLVEQTKLKVDTGIDGEESQNQSKDGAKSQVTVGNSKNATGEARSPIKVAKKGARKQRKQSIMSGN